MAAGGCAPPPAHVRGGPDLVLALAGMLGAFGLGITGGVVWPGVAGGLLGAGLGVLVWVVTWRAARHHRIAHG
jgi:Na+/proline symporter